MIFLVLTVWMMNKPPTPLLLAKPHVDELWGSVQQHLQALRARGMELVPGQLQQALSDLVVHPLHDSWQSGVHSLQSGVHSLHESVQEGVHSLQESVQEGVHSLQESVHHLQVRCAPFERHSPRCPACSGPQALRLASFVRVWLSRRTACKWGRSSWPSTCSSGCWRCCTRGASPPATPSRTCTSHRRCWRRWRPACSGPQPGEKRSWPARPPGHAVPALCASVASRPEACSCVGGGGGSVAWVQVAHVRVLHRRHELPAAVGLLPPLRVLQGAAPRCGGTVPNA